MSRPRFPRPLVWISALSPLALACALGPALPATSPPQAQEAPRAEHGALGEIDSPRPLPDGLPATPREARPPSAVPFEDVAPPAVPRALRHARATLAVHAPKLESGDREAVAHLIYRATRETEIPTFTLLGLIQQESRFDPSARGPRGSLGLMQIRPFVAEDVARRHRLPWRGKATLLDPVANVRIGIAYLAEQVTRFGSVERALAAYNIGPSRLKRRLAAGKTKRGPYVRKVLGKAAALSSRFGGPEPRDEDSLADAIGG